MARPRVALASAREARGQDPDEAPLLRALAAVGVEARPAVWDDPAVRWDTFSAVVVRSTWDYPPRLADFLAWGARVEAATRLLNPLSVLRWNTDKRYLRRLEESGVPVVPTTWTEPGLRTPLPVAAELVVKPVVSAGAKDTARYAADDEAGARAHVDRLHAEGRAAMVQPYLPSIAERGETALVWLGGAYSHAARKVVRLPEDGDRGLFAAETLQPHVASAAERAVAEAALAALPVDPATLAYARVDLAYARTGEPLVLEVELTEPSLFLAHGDGAAARLAAAVAGVARG